ncbi:DUF4157 domain-containing protein [Streptomyces sp. NBC_00250]|nr:DUF4157 domain-containing protein [Streptomyces sp. NBC_00250]
MLRQAGHPWAAPEPHQHGSGCGHQAESPAVQRSAVHDVLRSGGRPLDEGTRSDMEARLGADFSDVRIHTDAAAKASATEVGARAYTSGNHVVIGDGGADRHTLAHELTHVIQQRQGPVAGTDNGSGLKVSDPSDRFEREAEANARRALSVSAPAGDVAPRSEVRSPPAQRSVQRVIEETSSSAMAPPPVTTTQESTAVAAPSFGIELRSKADAQQHGLTKDNTLVVAAGHSGDMYHIRAAMLVDRNLKLVMYGLLDEFDEVEDSARIAERVGNSERAAASSSPHSQRLVQEYKDELKRLQIEAGQRAGAAGADKAAVKADYKTRIDAFKQGEVTRVATERDRLAETIRVRAGSEIDRERTERPRRKAALDRKALGMFQLNADLGPGRIFYTKKTSGEGLGLDHGGGENLATEQFKQGMLTEGTWAGADGGAERLERFYDQYAAPDTVTEQAFEAACGNPTHVLSRFREGVPYVIVNFRDSGHTGEGNAPALDTGREGLAQIQSMVETHAALGAGVKPIPIGGFPAPGGIDGPHLLEYWKWPEARDRRAQLALLRFLKKKFNILGAVGMRSGVTDQFAFAGIKTLSIDISPSRSMAAEGVIDHNAKVEEYPSKGWERGGKLEAVFGPNYGRAFLGQARENEGAVNDPTWGGPFGGQDQGMIRDAMGFYFGSQSTTAEPRATDEEFRHSSHPLHQSSRDALESSTVLGPNKKKAIRKRIEEQLKQDEKDRARKG